METLPSLVRMSDWELLYNMNTDGVSIGTFYEKCKKIRTTLIVIKDSKGTIFGGYCTEAWRTSTKFFGTGENFLFTFKYDNKITVYRWTGESD